MYQWRGPSGKSGPPASYRDWHMATSPRGCLMCQSVMCWSLYVVTAEPRGTADVCLRTVFRSQDGTEHVNLSHIIKKDRQDRKGDDEPSVTSLGSQEVIGLDLQDVSVITWYRQYPGLTLFTSK